jgi:hypothetical protein
MAPNSHIRNAAERAIRSFKDNLIAGICSTDKTFPMHLWDRLLPQAVITVNMLHISRINPNLSASTHIDGQYDYNRAPMAPPGTRIIAHQTPNRRRTWAPHGWYIGPTLEHYRCYMVYITKTTSERVVETVDIFSHRGPITISIIQGIGNSGSQTINTRLTQSETGHTIFQAGDEQMLALKRLATIFEGALPVCKKDTPSPLFEINDSVAQK